MKEGWKTRAIGRHLVDLPADARTIEQYKFNKVPIEPLSDIRTRERFDKMVSEQERSLRASKHKNGGSMFIERVAHANGSLTLISWAASYSESIYRFDTYFQSGSRFLKYAGHVSPSLRESALSECDELSREWREIPLGEAPSGVGYVVDDTILVDRDMNLESWRMAIRLAGKPDVSFEIASYAQDKVSPSLRERAGGALAGLLGKVAGLSRLRNRARPVGPIEADEILLSGTQAGKRGYGFKWEGPGKAGSLAKPNLNVTLEVRESAYTTNKESFASDEEALELWDAVVDSIRLRPGSV
ncbi:T6SS immunity protein Tli4 family protein [Cupriavidus sp. AcVe19-6a]|uniref:T6SS immunity protein Tli4 family protein n=1 Tax=Cupriavidus sp. AcVe19-6a TaxID=2821358 RepID=UPI001AE83C75|nr:T6SS immunity protein Tli4 family protein [Cupriavidus sp. AcVe19-6a]MBP0639249.1 hypothetical protein [Cupriavidus sp. AcVe19-6a]